MALIQLTPEDLRTSAQKYTSGAEEVRQVLRTLTNKRLSEGTGKVRLLIALINSLQHCLQKLMSLRPCLMKSMHSCLKLRTSLNKLTKILQHKFINLL